MDLIEYNAYYRQGLVDGLCAGGMPEGHATAFVKSAELMAAGARRPDEFEAGYMEALSKSAASYGLVPLYGTADIHGAGAGLPSVGAAETDDDEDADKNDAVPAVGADVDDDEDFFDKLRRWGIMAGIGAGAFAAGRYWPDIVHGVASTANSATSNFGQQAANEANAKAPQPAPGA